MSTHGSPGEHVPTIATARLRLRAHRHDDHAASAAMWAEANVSRYIGGTPSSSQQSWLRVLQYAGHWSVMGFGYWVVEETASGRFVGEVGFADFKRDLDPSLRGVPEAGWALTSPMRGRGFATEAVRAAVAWSDEHRAWERTICIVDARNAPSTRVAIKSGYGEVGRLDRNGTPTVVYARTTPPR